MAFLLERIGAEYVGIIQSLITTCKLHRVDPYVYLTDVLQRIDRHPNQQIVELTPRAWKEAFASATQLRSIAGDRRKEECRGMSLVRI